MRRVMSMMIVMVALTVFGAATVRAEGDKPVDKEKLSAAMELLKVTQLDRTLEKLIVNNVNFQIRQKPMLAPYKKVMLKFFRKYMSWDSLKDEIAAIYVEKFTTDELKEITAFYKTPAGQKLALMAPELSKCGAELGAQKVQAHITELKTMIAAEAARISNENGAGSEK